MQHIQTINEYLYEDKRRYTRWLSKRIIEALNKVGAFPSEQSMQNALASISREGSVKFRLSDEVDESIVSKLIKPFKQACLDKDNIVLSYDIKDIGQYYMLDIYYKTLHIHRVKPKRFVYHLTPTHNVENILINGIELQDSSRWTHRNNYLEYPASIFAANTDDFADITFFSGEDYTTLEIDTSSISNKWFADLNMTHLPGRKYIKIRSDDTPYIMTFTPIPARAIRVIDNYRKNKR